MLYFYTHLNSEADTSPAPTITPPQLFNNSEHPEFGTLRVLTINNDPWFVGKDVAEALGYVNSKKAISDHVAPDDKRLFQRSQNVTLEIPNRGMTIINESGLYSLIVGKDVAAALGYIDCKHAILDHIEKEDRVNSKTQGYFDPEFGQRGSWLINESGLYSGLSGRM